jgi:hypothetical protein
MLKNYTPEHLRTCLVCRGEMICEDDYDLATDCIMSSNYFIRHYTAELIDQRDMLEDNALFISNSRIIVGVMENTLYGHCLHYFTIIHEDDKYVLCQSYSEKLACSKQEIDISTFFSDLKACLMVYDKDTWNKYFPFDIEGKHEPRCITSHELHFYQ